MSFWFGDWQDEKGEFSALHDINLSRLTFIKRQIEKLNPSRRLKCLDIGCGGGILSESLLGLGFKHVVGIDSSEYCIDIAIESAKLSNKNIKYFHINDKCLSFNNEENFFNYFDAVFILEVLEHVEDWRAFVLKALKFLKKTGILFISTINKTAQSFFIAKILAEYILKKISPGTHEWSNFIKPKDLMIFLESLCFHISDISGISFDFHKLDWSLTDCTSVNYIMAAKRN